MMQGKVFFASDIYDKQNKIIHAAFTEINMPYSACKEHWIGLFHEVAGRKDITGLSDMTLDERRRLIIHLKRQGAKVKNPYVSGELTTWRKGDPEMTANNRPGRPKESYMKDDIDRGKMLRKIEAMLTDASLPWSYAHSIAGQMFGVERIEWCRPDQIHKIVAALVYDQKRRTK